MTEVWRQVPSVPALSASSLGKIRVEPYRGKVSRGQGTRIYGGHEWYGVRVKTTGGYRTMIHFRGKNYKVHRLVAEAFYGPEPFPRAVVMHLNDDATDNRIENLKWATQKENLNAPKFIAYCKSRTGVNSPTIKGRARKTLNEAPQNVTIHKTLPQRVTG